MEKEIAEVTNFFNKVSVVDIKLFDALKIGDKLHFKGANTDFEQIIETMETKGQKIESGSVGQTVGIKVKEKVRKNDKVFLVN